MACPHLPKNDPRCYPQQDSQEALDLAHTYCYDRYRNCVLYHELEEARKGATISAALRVAIAAPVPASDAEPTVEPEPSRAWSSPVVTPQPPSRSPAPRPSGAASQPPRRKDVPPEIALVQDLIRETLREEVVLHDMPMADRWRGGSLILQPRDASIQAKEISLDVFFKKITLVRERLRVLEQKINNHPQISEEDRIDLQGYITRAYGSLTTFNLLFRDRADWFVGQKSLS